MTPSRSTGAITLVAVIRAQAAFADDVDAALADVARWVAEGEPGTLAYHVSRGIDDPTVFTTFERFVDRAAMDAHNGSAAVAAFVAAVDGKLAAAIDLHIGDERSALARQRLPNA